jgi:hypothetical protein
MKTHRSSPCATLPIGLRIDPIDRAVWPLPAHTALCHHPSSRIRARGAFPCVFWRHRLCRSADLHRRRARPCVVTHEIGFARQVVSRVVFMDNREIVEDSSTPDFFAKPRSDRARTFLSKILQH